MSLAHWPPTGHNPQSQTSAPKTSPAALNAETKEQVFESLLQERLKLLPSVPTVRQLEMARWKARFNRAI